MDAHDHLETTFVFDVRRTLSGKSYSCYGSVKKQEDLELNVKICSSLRAKPQ